MDSGGGSDFDSRGLREISHGEIYHRKFDLARKSPPPCIPAEVNLPSHPAPNCSIKNLWHLVHCHSAGQELASECVKAWVLEEYGDLWQLCPAHQDSPSPSERDGNCGFSPPRSRRHIPRDNSVCTGATSMFLRVQTPAVYFFQWKGASQLFHSFCAIPPDHKTLGEVSIHQGHNPHQSCGSVGGRYC